MKTNEEKLEDLRVKTSLLLSLLADGKTAEEMADTIKSACNDFISLDISLIDGSRSVVVDELQVNLDDGGLVSIRIPDTPIFPEGFGS